MDFTLINENKIKICLSEGDLGEFELIADELDYSDTETKRMFWDVLSRAKKATGFNTNGHRVLVQLYPSKDGGCEMFVTRITPISEDYAAEIKGEEEKNEKKRKDSSRKKYTVFSFAAFRDLSSACRSLLRVGYKGHSIAYIDESKRWYLLLSNLDFSGYTPMDEYSFLLEFGNIENTESCKSYLSEHATELCFGDAVGKLSLI
ncbi:MAG: adaptor protein MecA [Ruminococcaceae bacterium]|nr:adaptor protein MecA [Oscillospiraceae bacterium]